jgi:predicted RNA-binding Zn-ribbon protein involved in translation (DUF1610 family)
VPSVEPHSGESDGKIDISACEACGRPIVRGEGIEQYQCPDCAYWETYDDEERR